MQKYNKFTLTRKSKNGTLDTPIYVLDGKRHLIGATVVTIAATCLLLSGCSCGKSVAVNSTPIYDVADVAIDDTTVIKYVANGEDVYNLPTESIFEGSQIPTISCSIPTRPGYTFLGWSTDPNAFMADSNYSEGQMYFGEDLVLYAVWETLEITPMVEDIIVQPETTKSFSLQPKFKK